MGIFFKGFPKETIRFLQDLSLNNSSVWFQNHVDEYKTYFVAPAAFFIEDLGRSLEKHVKGLIYGGKVNKSLFRLNRDVRFSKNKAPYKNNMGILLWKGPFSVKHENPGFYFHMESEKLYLATGIWMFTPPVLAEYRASLLHPRYGKEFEKVLADLQAAHLPLAAEQPLKNPPKDFPKDHPLAEYAKYKGIYTYFEELGGLPDLVFKEELLDYCLGFYTKTIPLLEWLVGVSERAHSAAEGLGTFHTPSR